MYSHDVGVAIIFFNRPNAVKRVFESVARARPSKLFLIQDGSRGEKDDAKVAECRKVVEQVDWPCEVYRNYCEENLGCGKRMSSGISWVFEHVEKAIILEDDCVPSESFYPFCYELLEKYKDDERVLYISGLNHWGKTECDADYLFAYNGAIWGWATWRRAWEKFDYSVSAIQNRKVQEYLLGGVQPYYAAKQDVEKWIETNTRVQNGERLSYWAHQWRLCKYLYHSLTIIPKENLIDNVGDADPTHPVVGGCAFHHMKTGKMEFPLKHPQYVIQDIAYDKRYYQNLMPSIVDKIKSKLKRMMRIG
ncbi:MAG: hemolysin activation protein [Phocaeicola sp.]